MSSIGANIAACLFIRSETTRQWPSFGVATKLNPDWDFLCRLRDSGRVKTAEWLDSNFDKVGQSSTVDLAEIFF
jgi:NTE family protein